MKKNRLFRAATVLLVLTLITSCFVGGTFAKYTSSTTGSDNARVAYWGFDQAATTEIHLFDGTYTNVKSSGEVDGITHVIAPGTEDSTTFAFGYTNYKTDKIGAPEVAYTFKVDPSIAGSYAALDANPSFKWTLQKGTGTVNEYETVSALLAAIKALSGDNSGTKTYNPGQLPAAFTAADEVYTIGWKWAYESPTQNAVQDAVDTGMGNSQNLDNVTFSITITATQLD